MSNKQKWIIGGAIVVLVVLAGLGIAGFGEQTFITPGDNVGGSGG